MDIEKEKVIFFHMNQLGDLLFSFPLLAAARKTWQDKKIYSLARKEFAAILKAAGFVDEVIIKPDDLFSKLDLLNKLKKEGFKKSVLFSESPESLLLSYFSNIPQRYGFQTASLNSLLTNKTPRMGVPSIANNKSLAGSLGLTGIPDDYSGLVAVPEIELNKAQSWLAKERITSGFVVISPGASKKRKEKCWIKENWVKVIQLIKNTSLIPVLTGAPNEYGELAAIAKDVNGPVRIFVPNEGIMPLAALMKKARLFAGIDSGAMHLAASLQVPVVALFALTDPGQVGPFPLEKNTVIKKNAMMEITPQEVFSAISSLYK
ncbi:MAG: glycosyltransferase family 9 protein [Elusimicrobia bacterium]|nr:glycosyltransferase family 9 protein [Candidatus Liberimonas magnetica]